MSDAWETLKARGFVQQVTNEGELREAFAAGPVTFYVGFDPTADSLHVGHMLPVMAMAHLQRAGHVPIAVVGGGTVMVGDPTGRTELRQMLSRETIETNKAAIKAQLRRFLVIDDVRGRMVDNADWLLPLNYIEFLRDIGRHFSVNRMLATDAYKLRLERGLSFIEFNYQLLQAYDFLVLFREHGCALQLGGDDQWANILAGSDLIRRLEGKPAHGLTLPLILTATGEKMGKTAAGAVWLDANKLAPFDFWQYWYNVDDRDVGRFLRMYTFLPLDEVTRLETLVGAGLREAKRVLANEFTTLVHGAEAAAHAEAAARAMVAGEASADLATFAVDAAPQKLVAVIADSGLAKSRGEARRLIQNGGVYLGGERVVDAEAMMAAAHVAGGVVLKVGKSRAVRLVARES
jgi:tyrosyl-tRNA synthetase